jgi:hypothetical protein
MAFTEHQLAQLTAEGWVVLRDCLIMSETARAYHVHYQGQHTWFPKSQMHPDADPLYRGQRDAVLVVTKWIIEAKLTEIKDEARQVVYKLRELEAQHLIWKRACEGERSQSEATPNPKPPPSSPVSTADGYMEHDGF